MTLTVEEQKENDRILHRLELLEDYRVKRKRADDALADAHLALARARYNGVDLSLPRVPPEIEPALVVVEGWVLGKGSGKSVMNAFETFPSGSLRKATTQWSEALLLLVEACQARMIADKALME
ncbi:hypothetical protein PYCC9005_005769 [Savitreella phatthalungensis]